MKSEDRPTFARAVWSEFVKLSGREREMSAAEWYVLSKWMDQSIPLPVILRAFEEFQGKPRRLEALVVPVDKAYAYWRQAMGCIPGGEVPL